MRPGDLDLADPVLHAEHDLAEVWRELRATAPVWWHREVDGRPGFWVVSTHAEATAVYLDATRFGSARGNVLASLLAGGDSAGGVMAAVTDGRRHRDLRRVLMEAFSPRALAGVVDRVAGHARRLVADAVGAGGCDFAEDVAAHLPLTAICDLLGVPEEDRPVLLAATRTALSSDTAEQSPIDAWEARNVILGHFERLAADRRARPGSDAVSVLVAGSVDGVPLTTDEVVANCYSLVLGGDETARLAVIGAVRAFVEHPDQWRAWRDGDVAVGTAVDEVLRWTTPAIHFGRTATVDTTLGGKEIDAGDIVTVWNSSANRDEAVFDRPEVFDLARTPNRHLSLGHGPHYCVGAHLGRAEIGAMLTALREHVVDIEPTGPPLPIYSTMLSGFRSLPVRLIPRR
ncbi:cytochrome P450 [Actinosynnema sp. NPDC020468]|uniref:cytochrome P450 n=1 Tax=Actinosynnema sp. NPDC020468 TaxID=3154488 RepID=UPI0033DF42F8